MERRHVVQYARRVVFSLILTILALHSTGTMAHGSSPFVQRSGVHFTLEGRPFYFGGTNIHYLPWGSAYEVNNALHAAVAMHLRVIRTFASLVVGSPTDASVKTIWEIHRYGSSSNMNVHGVYYQYWNAATQSQGFNDGPNGLKRLDYVVARASQMHLKLIIALVDNWKYTGGIDQYLAWHGLKDHDAFFIDP
jgi:mannan endo-1,4-beta-mannosidase